jgi:hypothetical protein
MIGRIIFLSIAAFVSYKYIGRSNRQVQKEIGEVPGTVQILPPENPSGSVSAATEQLRGGRATPRISSAAEDLSGK